MKVTITYRQGKERRNTDSLFLLYRPLAGNDGCLLYEILFALGKNGGEWHKEELVEASGLTPHRYEKAMNALERVGLLFHWKHPVKQDEIYELALPADPDSFLRDPVYGRLLLDAVGSGAVDRLMRHFTSPSPQEGGYISIGAKIDSDHMEKSWSDQKEEQFVRLQPRVDTSGFDWNKFYAGFDQQLPYRVRTPENEAKIAELARAYGLSEDDMRVYAIRACPPPARVLDVNRLAEMVAVSRKAGQRQADDPFKLDPLSFLRLRQNGAPVADADRRLIEKVRSSYHLEPEVIVRLLDYTLKQMDGQLPAKYVEKVAAGWVRAGINTADKAQNWIRDSKSGSARRQNVSEKDWYGDLGDQSPTDAKLLEEIEALRARDREKQK